MKEFFKKILPIVFLKQAFLQFNSLKSKTLDRVLFATYQPTETELKLYEKKNPFLDLAIDTKHFSSDIQDGFHRWQDPNWNQDQYIIEIKDKAVFIESHTGWGLVNGNKLIYFSLGFANAPYVHKPRIKEFLFKRRKEVFLPKVISLRDTGEENYFHFYNDILTKLLFLRDNSLLDYNAHIVVSHLLWNKNYFQTFLNNTWLGQLQWYPQKDEWMRTNHVIFCKPYTHTKKYLIELVRLMTPALSTISNNKVLLIRGPGSLRFIENEEEIFSVLLKYGFQKVDAAKLTLEEQINIFANALDVVAVHGAGITNIIFRNGSPLRLLELFHWNEYLPFHYIMLARVFSFNYAALRGRKGAKSAKGGFYINPQQVEDYCKAVLTV